MLVHVCPFATKFHVVALKAAHVNHQGKIISTFMKAFLLVCTSLFVCCCLLFQIHFKLKWNLTARLIAKLIEPPLFVMSKLGISAYSLPIVQTCEGNKLNEDYVIFIKTYFIYYQYTMYFNFNLTHWFINILCICCTCMYHFFGMHFSSGCIVRLNEILGKNYTTRRRNAGPIESIIVHSMLFFVLSVHGWQPSECLIVSLQLPNAE